MSVINFIRYEGNKMWIKSYISAIAVTVIFSAFAESLMPETEMKKHISLVVGIIILIVISKPVLSIPVFNENILDFAESASIASVEISERLNNTQSDEIRSVFIEKLDNNIEKDIYNKFSVKCNVNIAFKNQDIEYVYVETAENEGIRKHIEEIYGFKCVFEKDG